MVRTAAVGVAAAQLALAAACGAEEFWVVAFLAWGGALFVARGGDDRAPALVSRLAGAVLEVKPRHAAWLAGSAIAVVLVVNALRIAALAALAERGLLELFDLWHMGGPSHLVSAVATIVWGGITLLVLRSRATFARN